MCEGSYNFMVLDISSEWMYSGRYYTANHRFLAFSCRVVEIKPSRSLGIEPCTIGKCFRTSAALDMEYWCNRKGIERNDLSVYFDRNLTLTSLSYLDNLIFYRIEHLKKYSVCRFYLFEKYDSCGWSKRNGETTRYLCMPIFLLE